MDGITIIILIVLVTGILVLLYISCYNNIQTCVLKINEAESKIDDTLRERFDLLNKAALFIRENTNEEVLTELNNLDNENLSSFDFDRKLASITSEFYTIKFNNRKLTKLENFTDIDFNLRENEATLDGYTSYYNDNISKFNKLVRVFPSNIIAKISSLNEKTFYDGKNMTDKSVNDFKL